jgi:hypothetical protein
MPARLFALSLLAVAGVLMHATAHAEVLRCNDANGKTLYTDSACPAGMRAVRAAVIPQACTTEDCERRREREVALAHERVRAEKEQLAAFTAERHKREIEERWIDEARYEAELRSAAATPIEPAEVYYPAYPLYGYGGICGKRCIKNPPRHHVDHHVGRAAHKPAPEPRRAPRVTGTRGGFRGEMRG